MEPVRPVFQEAPVQMPPSVGAVAPVPPQPNELQKPKLHHKLSFILPAIVVLGSIIGGVLITDWVLRNRAIPEPAQTPEPSLAPATPVPTVAPAVQLKTYYNQDRGFSFVYPDTLVAVECANGVRLFQSLPEDVEVSDTCNSSSGGVIKVYYDRQPIVTGLAEGQTEDVITVAGYDAIAIQNASENSYLRQVTFERERIYYAIELTSSFFINDFEQLLASFKFIGDLTKGWTFYSNINYRYQMSYPSDWNMEIGGNEKVEVAKNLEFRKNEVDAKQGSLAIEADNNIADAGLTAREVISSTKNLQGWATSPSLELRQIGGGTAQVLQGQFNGHWQTFIVVWYKNRLVQMVWNDSVEQPNAEILEGFLSTFRFI